MIEVEVAKLGIDVTSNMPIIILKEKEREEGTDIVTLRYFVK